MYCDINAPKTLGEDASGSPTPDEITISFYPRTTTGAYEKTHIDVVGGNINFVSFVRMDRGPTPLNEGNSGPAGRLNWSADFAGGPTIGNGWTIRLRVAKAQGAIGTNQGTITVSGYSDFQTMLGGQDPIADSVSITLVDASGAFSKPLKPKRFRAKTFGATAINLTWAKVDSAARIIVKRATDEDFTENVFEWEINGSKTSYLDFGTAGIDPSVPALSPSTQYFYQIRGTNSLDPDGSSPSDTADATTIATPAAPDPPEDVRAAGNPRSTEVVVSFEPISNLVVQTGDGKVTLEPAYQVYYAAVAGGPYTAFDAFREDKSVKVTGLDPNTEYFFVVKSSYLYAPAAISANSNEDSVTTGNISGTPSAPTGFTATVDDFTDIILTWNNNNNGQATYDILRAATLITNPYSTVVTGLAGGTTTYTDADLTAATAYFYRIRAVNSVGPSAYSTATATTDALPAAPPAPSGLSATPVSDSAIALDIATDLGGELPTHIEVFRGIVTGGPYTSVGEIVATEDGTVYHFVDSNDLASNATYFYVAKEKNRGGSSANSAEASATTFPKSATQSSQSAFTFSPGSSTNIIPIGSRAVHISDSDRMVVYTNRGWFLGGIKRQLNAPTLAASAGGALAADTYTVFTVLYSSKRATRSLPSNGAEVVVTAGQRIRITPDLDTSGSADIVLVRDVAYNSANEQILAADYVEFYIASTTSANAYLVATVPVNDPIWDAPGYYELPATLTTQAIFGSERRPMELLGESSLPPACSQGEAKDNRLILFGEKTYTPTAEETADGALVSIANGATTFTAADYTLHDGMIYHELYLNGDPTGWEIYDIDTDTNTAYIRHADPDINAQGYRGLSGSFSDFNLAARASRVYYSAFFTGEANGTTTYSPETFPPLTHFEAEFFPQDNTDPNSIITSNADLIVGKPSKMMLVRGGGEPDFPLINVISLSQSSGLNAPDTICRDSRDVVYYLGDSGPFAVAASGVQKLNVQCGNQNLFTQLFDINSVAAAQGTWYSQQDWFVVAGINRYGKSGFRDGFIYDPNLELLCPFSTPYQITWIQEVKNIFGQYQILFGDADGRLGILFKPNLSADGIDYTIAAPSVFATPISGYMRGPIMQTQNRITVRSFQPQIFMQNGATARCRFSVAKKDRMDDPYAFNPQKVVSFDTDDTRTYFSLASHSYQNTVVQFDFTLPVNPTDARMSWREIVLELVNRGPL